MDALNQMRGTVHQYYTLTSILSCGYLVFFNIASSFTKLRTTSSEAEEFIFTSLNANRLMKYGQPKKKREHHCFCLVEILVVRHRVKSISLFLLDLKQY